MTFDTHPEIKLDFQTVTDAHQARLELAEPVGNKTALFDAINFCLNQFEKLDQIHGIHPKFFYVLTDGCSNFGTKTTKGIDAKTMRDRTNQLHIAGYVIHVGSREMSQTNEMCDQLDYRYINLHDNSTSETARSLIECVSTQAKSIMAVPHVNSTAHAHEKTLEMWRNAEALVRQLPDIHSENLLSEPPQSEHVPPRRVQPVQNVVRVQNRVYLAETNTLTQ